MMQCIQPGADPHTSACLPFALDDQEALMGLTFTRCVVPFCVWKDFGPYSVKTLVCPSPTGEHVVIFRIFLNHFMIHPQLRNINLHNVKYSLISRNPREHVFVVQSSFFVVTFLSFLSRILSLMQITVEVNPHPRIAPRVNMWSVTFFFFFSFLCLLLNVGACVQHIAQEGQVEWTTLA